MSDDKIEPRIGVTYFIEGDGERLESTQMLLLSELMKARLKARLPNSMLDQMVRTAYGDLLRKRERQLAAANTEAVADGMGKIMGNA